MENSDDQPLKVLKTQLTEYIELRTEQARLGLVENSAKITAYFTSAVIIVLLVMLCLLSLVVACSFFIGQWLHSYGLGFLISGGIFLLFLILFIVSMKKKTEGAIINKIIQLTNEQE
jgi:hypothetical protein